MFKYDLHVHTSQSSQCGHVRAEEVVRLYKDAGYSGICITDHYYEPFFEKQTGSWQECIDAYLSGCRAAQRIGREAGLLVMLGMEIRLSGYNEYLIYGLTEEFLYENPALYQSDFLSFSRRIREAGMLIYQAHPLRPNMVLAERGLLSGVEGYNGNPRHNPRNEEMIEYATQHAIPFISGSDFHRLEDLARGGIVTRQEITSSDMLVEILKSSAYQFIMT